MGFLYAGFGEASPEAKAAKNLHNFFTYIAVKIVSAQLEVLPNPSHVSIYLFVLFTYFIFQRFCRSVLCLQITN